MASEKQVKYAMHLLAKAGYSTRWMNREHAAFATMRERSGTVQDWLAAMESPRISNLIDTLKKKVAEAAK